MGAATVDSSVCNQQLLNGLHAESIPLIDLRLLSQSELLLLSLCSSSSSLHHLQNDTDVSTPRIDRSVFNESAGSRKQTFSRLRLAPRNNSQFSSSSFLNRTPIPYQNTEQPLDDENSQIVSVLKSLFGADSNPIDNDDNLVSVPVHYKGYLTLPSTNNVELQNISTGIVDSSGGSDIKPAIPAVIVDSSSKKRRRGRPRKNETNISNNDNNNNNNNNNQVVESEWNKGKMIFRNGNVEVESKEKEDLVNKNGVMVDLAALGSMEDLYEEELRRRTEGMQTEAELLGVLQGLEGEWGSRRKKRKIVDASVFGGALPRGWKLMLCVKKKAGYVWLSCRRYISPTGQQFVSCKEVSSYLLALCGPHNASWSSFDHIDGSVQFTDQITSGNAADPTLRDGKNGDDLICYSALPITSKSTEPENQAMPLTTGSPVEVQTGRKYKCHKCTMVFDEKDELLQHLLSAHHRAPKRLRCETSVTEEVIIKNGKYECQFCNKAFEERHRYHGHLGIHIKDYFKRLEASTGGITIQKNTEPASVGVPCEVLKIQKSIGIDRDSISVTSNIKTNDEISSAAPHGNIKANTFGETYCGKQDRECSIRNDKVEKMNEASDVVAAEISVCLGPESFLSNNENNTIHKSSDEANVPKCTESGINNFCRQEKSYQNCSFGAAGRGSACVVDNNVNQVPTSLMEEHNQDRGSKSGLLGPNAEEKTLNDENIEDTLHSTKMDDMEIDDWDLVGKGEKITGCGNSYVAQEGVVTDIKGQKSSAICSVVPSGNDQRYGCADNVTELLPSIVLGTILEGGSKGCLFTSMDEQTFIENNVNNISSSMPNKSKFDEVGKSGNNEFTIGSGSNNSVPVEDNLTSIKQGRSHGRCVVIPSLHDVENNMNRTPKYTGNKPHQEKESEGSQLTLFHSEQSFHFKTHPVKVSNSTMEATEHDQVQCSKNGEFSSDVGLVAESITNIEQERNSNSCLLVSSANDQSFVSKDYGVCQSTLEKLMQGANSEHRPSHDGQTHGDEKNMNKVSCMTIEEHKHKSTCNGELPIAFGHGQTEQDADVVTSTVQERCSKGCFVFSENQQTFAAKDSVTGPYNGAVDELKQKRDSEESLLRLSGSEQVQSVENNLHRVSACTVQEDPRFEDLEDRRKNELGIGFCSYARPNENDISELMWRNDEENDMLSGFADASSQPVQTSARFHPYDVISDKGASDLFGEKFDGISGFEGQKLGSMANMEYNFRPSQVSSHSDESKIFSCNAEAAQRFDSSVWMEKEALPLLPKIASRLHVPTICVWCRNEFQQEALESEAQTGSIGFMCAACKAKFSGQLN